jgi:manganese transport protein
MNAVPIAIAESHAPSLEGFHGTISVPARGAGFWRNYRAFVGPALLVSVGYMDPGNWATDLEAGARYKYGLLWVVAASSFMAIVMQILSARLGIVTGKDLAQACRDFYPAWTRVPNWLLCEVAICACDLAEVLGSAIAINLLFPDIPILWAVVITAFDVLVLLALQGFGMRFLEAIILVLVGTIGLCYFVEIFVLPQTKPSFVEMGAALVRPGFPIAGMIPVAIGILGATVMPHNLYLHSALVRSRRFREDPAGIRQALRFNTIDTVLALSIAFFINAAILVLAAQTFYGRDLLPSDPDADVQWITVAYKTLPLLGTTAASVLFALALLASGQSSTITGTLAGQVVMEGFMHWRLRPWIRRLATRTIAIVPAILVVGVFGDDRVNDLLVLTQIVLALQLPFAMVPLLHFTSSRRHMGEHRNGWLLGVLGWTSCALIIALVVYGLPESLAKAQQALSPTPVSVSDR